MKIQESTKTKHELLGIESDDGKNVELVDIHKAEDGELLSVTVGSTEITPEIWEILLFLKEEGKL